MNPNPKQPPGRKKGIPNKLAGTAKENILGVFMLLGGRQAMAAWAKKHPTDFYRIYSRMLPHEVSGPEGGPIQVAEPTMLDLARRTAFLLASARKKRQGQAPEPDASP